MKKLFVVFLLLVFIPARACDITCALAISIGMHVAVLFVKFGLPPDGPSPGAKPPVAGGGGRLQVQLDPVGGNVSGTIAAPLVPGETANKEMPFGDVPAGEPDVDWTWFNNGETVTMYTTRSAAAQALRAIIEPQVAPSNACLSGGGCYWVDVSEPYSSVITVAVSSYMRRVSDNANVWSGAINGSNSQMTCGTRKMINGSCFEEERDRRRDLKLEANVWSPRAMDADKDDSTVPAPTIAPGGASWKASGLDPVSKEPVLITATKNGDGSSQIRIDAQSNASGVSAVRSTRISVNAGGIITDISSDNAPGAISDLPGSGTGTPGAAGGASPGVVPGAGGGNNVLNFPTDYARAGEAGVAAGKVIDKMCGGTGQPACKIDGSGVDGVDNTLGTAKADLNTKHDAHKAMVEGLATQGDHGLNWSWVPMLPQCNSCTVWTLSAGAAFTQTIDPCPIYIKIAEIGAYVMGFMTMITLFNIMTQKPG